MLKLFHAYGEERNENYFDSPSAGAAVGEEEGPCRAVTAGIWLPR